MSRVLLVLPMSAVITLLIACGYGPGDPGKLCSINFNAVNGGDVKAAQQEIDRGADINARCEDNSTPLHVAVGRFYPHVETVQLLLANGADINARNYREFTPLHLATLNQQPHVVLLLIEHGADVNAQNNRDQSTPLHRAMINSDNPQVVELLLLHGADPNAINRFGNTPLLELVALGNPRVQVQHARLLIEYGADLNSRPTPCEHYSKRVRVNSELRNLLCR